MPPWNFEATRALVSALHSEAQADRVWSALQSIYKRQHIAAYHFHEYKRLLKERLDPQLEVKRPLELILSPEDDEGQSIHTIQLHVLAHVIACMQSLHALGDTLAYAIALSLGIDCGPKPLPESKITVGSVLARIEQEPRWSQLHGALRELQANADFELLTAVVNHSKHRSIIVADFHFDATGTAPSIYQFRLPTFTFKGKSHESRDVETFLEPLYAWLSPQIVACGNALNASLLAGRA